MSEDFGPNFVTISDDSGQQIELEYVDALEHKGTIYMAFFPAESEDGEEPDYGLVILKQIVENGQEILSTLDSDEELNEVYELFMEQMLWDEE